MIGVYASCRNEIGNLDAWLDSVKGADCIALNDTGSTDGTWEALQEREGLIVAQLPDAGSAAGRFNAALSLLPDDIDWCIRLDLDERLQPGWREALDNISVTGPTVLHPWFDHDGLIYRHDRIHTPGFRWELPIHEVLVCDGPFTNVPVEVTIEHHQDLTKDRSSSLPLLEQALADDPTNLRFVHYLGREYTYYSRWADAIPLLHQHATSDAFREERSESWRLLGDCYNALLPKEDVPWRPFFQAAITAPERREGWLSLAEWHYEHGEWDKVLAAAREVLKITERSQYFNHAWAWGPAPYDLAALASFYLGHTDDAVRYGEQALELAPDDERLVTNLGFYTGRLAA